MSLMLVLKILCGEDLLYALNIEAYEFSIKNFHLFLGWLPYPTYL